MQILESIKWLFTCLMLTKNISNFSLIVFCKFLLVCLIKPNPTIRKCISRKTISGIMVKTISQNVHGLQNKEKRKSIFYFLKQKADIICLQETHSEPSINWDTEWGDKRCYWSHGSSAARGVAILVYPRSSIKIIENFCDQLGRIVGISYEDASEQFVLLNLYAPNDDRPDFFVNAFRLLENYTTRRIILGDFNITLNKMLDRIQNASNNDKSTEVIEQYIEDTMMCDIWRVRNPESKIYTYIHKKSRQNPEMIGSRLDFIFVDVACESWITEVIMHPRYKTDHSAVSMNIVPYDIKRGKGYWKFNNRILQEIEYLQLINREIEQIEGAWGAHSKNGRR